MKAKNFIFFLISLLFSVQSLHAQGEISNDVYADGKKVNYSEGFSINSIPGFISVESSKYDLGSARGVNLYVARGVRAFLEKKLKSYEELTRFNIREWMKGLEVEDRFIVEFVFSEKEDEIEAALDPENLVFVISISE